MRTLSLNILCLSALLLITACGTALNKLEHVGKQPEMAEVANPHTKPDYKPMTWPMPNPEPPAPKYVNSLWQPGARAFFRDQRAARVGDILRVKIVIQDKAEVDNESKRERGSSEKVSVPNLLAGTRERILPGAAADPLFGITGDTNNNGKGEIKREEKITTQVAASVTQILPNGNMVIEGSQEIRVNYELREVSIKGVIRPEDIGADNTIDSSQIAEARIIYGGRGQMTDLQQPRWGHQVIDILSPF